MSSYEAIAIGVVLLTFLVNYFAINTKQKEFQILFTSLGLLLLDISFYVISEIASQAGLTGLKNLFLGIFNGFMFIFIAITFILVALYLYDLLVKFNKIKTRG
jgi:hypothetical protein